MKRNCSEIKIPGLLQEDVYRYVFLSETGKSG
jgi:hypothetical protein